MADPTAMGTRSHNRTVPITSAKEHECHSSNIPVSQPDKPQRKQLIKEGDEVIKEAFGN